MTAAALLEVRDLRKNYGSHTALAGVTFSVQPGELFGLLGPNGAGKTTLLSILSGLSEPTSGEVLLLGQPFDPSQRHRRGLVGIVPQELALYDGLTARENLRFFGELFGIHGVELHRRVAALLEAVGLAERANHRVGTFSGGMKRRLNLACALVHQPRLILLDEPTVGVDPQSRNLIFEEVRRLNAAGTTIVYTSHYMEEVQALCSRIGIIDQGQMLACATLDQLLLSLRGLLRCRIGSYNATLHQRLSQLCDCQIVACEGGLLEIKCADVKATLLQLVSLLTELQVELLHLETEEPNLERVFLHLTGHALRD
jgi:ABC-2 type transport system ATP-binding protein